MEITMNKIIILLLSIFLVIGLLSCTDGHDGNNIGLKIDTKVISSRALNADQIINPKSLWFLGGQINFFTIESLETLKSTEWGTESLYTQLEGT